MPSYRQEAEKRQARFRAMSSTISLESRDPSDSRGQRTDYLLALSHETDNLYPTLRERDLALNFFAERSIKWWKGSGSGDDTSVIGPTRSMMSSQVACVNFLLPLAGMDGALAAVLHAVDGDVKDIVPIEHEGNTSLVEFEWIGLGGPLEEGEAPTRGKNITNIDALIVAETDAGRRAYLMEWKYTESCPIGEDKGNSKRRGRYSTRYNAESSSFNGNAPLDELLYEPFYQLMRQRLLADRMMNDTELGVTDAKVIAVVPECNNTYRERITSPPLARRFPNLKTVSDVFRATLKQPDEAYTMVCPSTLVAAVERECGDSASEWVRYQRERYGL